MARLTEQEIQEIIRFVEAGKSLPDKYRFLLFEDKHKVECGWSGRRLGVQVNFACKPAQYAI